MEEGELMEPREASGDSDDTDESGEAEESAEEEEEEGGCAEIHFSIKLFFHYRCTWKSECYRWFHDVLHKISLKRNN